MKRSGILTIITFFLAVGVAAAQTPDPKKVADGQKAYDVHKCNTCHTVKGQGSKAASALDGVGAKLSAADIKGWLTNTAAMEAKLKTKPKVPMSMYMKGQKLTDADVDALVAYMSSLK